MKKLLTGMLSLALLAATAVPALAADSQPLIAPAPAAAEETASTGYTIEIDGRDSAARARVMVPLRALAEELGFTVAWDNGLVTVTGPDRYAELTIGVDQYFAAPTQEGLAGASLFSLGCAPVLINDVTYVPVDLFDALLGCREGTVVLEDGAIKISTGAVQIPNPFTDRATLAEAAAVTGFPMSCPDTLEGYPQRMIQTMNEEMIQVIYQNGDRSITVRKEAGSGDISGDYTQYPQAEIVKVGSCAVTMRGENGLILAAVWENGGYAYSVTAGDGMSLTAMIALIQSVN